MSAFGGKADMTYCSAKCPLLTQSGHSKRHIPLPSTRSGCYHYVFEPRGGGNEAARLHYAYWRGGGLIAASGARAASRELAQGWHLDVGVRERQGIPISTRHIPRRTREIRMGRESQYPLRLPRSTRNRDTNPLRNLLRYNPTCCLLKAPRPPRRWSNKHQPSPSSSSVLVTQSVMGSLQACRDPAAMPPVSSIWKAQ